jgi:hypothetical protein
VAELADATALGAVGRKAVRVRVPSPAPLEVTRGVVNDRKGTAFSFVGEAGNVLEILCRANPPDV